MKRIIVVSFVCFLFISINLYAQITVTKTASEANPNLYISEVNSNKKIVQDLKDSFQYSGWFNPVRNRENADYIVEVKKKNQNCILAITGEQSFRVKDKLISDYGKLTNSLVDSIINYLFDVPGICSSRIAFVLQRNNEKEIFTTGIPGDGIKQITRNNDLSLKPSWGMDSNMLVYTYYHQSYMDVVGYNLNNEKTYSLSRYAGHNDAGAISPNGNYLAVVLSKDGQVDLYIKSLDGKGLQKITNNKAVEDTPVWSTDGAKLAFVSDKSIGRPRIYIHDFNTDKTRRLDTAGSEALNPDWSPVGNKIVYSAKLGGDFKLFIHNLNNGRNSRVKIERPGKWLSPSWAPDGRHIVCSMEKNYHSKLYIVDTWTGKTRLLLDSEYDMSSPDWSGLIY